MHKTFFSLLCLLCLLLCAGPATAKTVCSDNSDASREIFANTLFPAFIMPVPNGELSSHFGYRKLYRYGKARMHSGIDIRAPRGSAVLAAASGTVLVTHRNGSYGKTIDIDHGNGIVSRYAHLDSFRTKPGTKVESGEIIGTVGRSGRTTGANLHFELLVDNQAVNPAIALGPNVFAPGPQPNQIFLAETPPPIKFEHVTPDFMVKALDKAKANKGIGKANAKKSRNKTLASNTKSVKKAKDSNKNLASRSAKASKKIANSKNAAPNAKKDKGSTLVSGLNAQQNTY